MIGLFLVQDYNTAIGKISPPGYDEKILSFFEVMNKLSFTVQTGKWKI
jgi:hypothetical protein